MSFRILGLGTATPSGGIRQSHAATVAQTICCENDQQRRMLTALYRRAGVDYRHSVLLEGDGDRAATGLLTHTLGTVLPEGFSVRRLADESIETDVEDCVRQTFFEPAVNADDCGPTTAQRMLMYEHHAPTLASSAVHRALDSSGVLPDEITHLITVSCTGFAAPGVDLALIRSCGLSPTVTRTSVGFMGCHGAINGLRVAQAYADADPKARILLCAVELCSLHQQYGWHPDRIVSNSLFADGAAAVVGCGSNNAAPLAHDDRHWSIAATASMVIPESEDLMSWCVRDHGFEMSLSAQVPATIRETLHPWLSAWLAEYRLTVDQIGSWAVHPGGPRVLLACEQALNLSNHHLQESRSILSEYGNMSSPTILFVLERLRQQQRPLPCVLLAFGPGLTAEAALIVG